MVRRYHNSFFRRPAADDASTLLKSGFKCGASWTAALSFRHNNNNNNHHKSMHQNKHTEEEENTIPSSPTNPPCLICLDPLSASDIAHPILCKSTHCSFNFCAFCIETIIQAKQQQVIPCPNCRSPLQTTVFDTLLLRKVDDNKQNGEWKKAMDENVSVLKDIADARYREAKFWKLKSTVNTTGTTLQDDNRHKDHFAQEIDNDDEDDDTQEEWGFEVDERVGPHASIKLPQHVISRTIPPPTIVDVSLLRGLEAAMSKTEKECVIRWLTSGDTEALVRAAKALAAIVDGVYAKKQQHNTHPPLMSMNNPHENQQQHGGHSMDQQENRQPPERHPILSMAELIHASRAARRQPSRRAPPPPQQRRRQQQPKPLARHHLMQSYRRQHGFLRHYPLPTRMPKYARFSPKAITLVLDTWDGTLAEAFVSNTSTAIPTWVNRHDRVAPPTRRLVVGQVVVTTSCQSTNDAVRRHGIVPGDVVSMVWNGRVEWTADHSIDQLFVDQDDEQEVEWVFNADRSVAEALKLRAKAVAA